MIPGYEVVGRIDEDGYPWFHEVIASDDILAFSYAEDGPLRHGVARARNIVGVPNFDAKWPHHLLVASGDYIFRAIAVGERAFRTGRHKIGIQARIHDVDLPPEGNWKDGEWERITLPSGPLYTEEQLHSYENSGFDQLRDTAALARKEACLSG